ncbi:MAG TPA: 3-dehydroquinate synthase [Bacteroidota bacterium]|nr:3-dehydroquinate synthase [Bacteroidota bacterium]
MTNPRVRTIRVPLGNRSYPIYIGPHVISSVGSLFKRHRMPKTAVIITDSRVAKLYLRQVERGLTSSGFSVRSVVIPPGEAQKSLQRADAIYSKLLRWKVERQSSVVALGGGVVGDLAGFVASTYQRGVQLVQMPTTLLAQVDSSVGGKVGINHPLGKNMVGSFYQPAFVAADISTLDTLPTREIVCGLGEVVKYGMIMDEKFFSYAVKNIDAALSKNEHVLEHLVAECCRMKAYVVSHDERERNLRAILNFGHTIGHALEHAGGYRLLKHGEAVLLGMVAETFAALQLGCITRSEAGKIESAILSIPLPQKARMKFSAPSLLATMRVDKKVSDGKIRLVLPEKVGKVTLPVAVGEKTILASLSYLSGFLTSLE